MIGQRPKRLLLFGEPPGSPRVGLIDDPLHKRHVFVAAVEVATATE
jgi:hypothetical protein